MERDLSDVEVRVLASLVEKAATTPDNYPLSSNALVAACNQKTSRDPVVDYDERTVDAAMLTLRERGLARSVRGGTSRVTKHRHVLGEALGLAPGELAVLAVLALRGAQTPGELRTRADRQHEFADLDEVDQTLDALAGREPPLVVDLGRAAGQKETRYGHLLGADADEDTVAEPAPAAVPPAATPASSLGETAVGARTDVRPAGEGAGGASQRPVGEPPVRAEIAALRAEVADLRAIVDELRRELGLEPGTS